MSFGRRTLAPGQKCLSASFVRGIVTAFGTAVTPYGVGLLLGADGLEGWAAERRVGAALG